MPRLAKRALQVVAGLLVGLLMAEALFWWRDRGAFPHLNLYVPDERLGVRLRPEGSQRLSFGGNPVTRVRINPEGLRGAPLPPPQPGEVLVVGDSQVFGLGVEEDETFSAWLDALLPQARVVNAGVPTYGPAEYVAMLEEWVPRRKPAVVVLTLNVVNDFFEAERPNVERHRVWDGWAVRSETAPAEVSALPGRALLFRESHAVFALRRWLYAREPVSDERGFASEGTWKDMLGAAEVARRERQQAEAETRRRAQAHSEALRHTEGQLELLEGQLNKTLRPVVSELMYGAGPGEVLEEGEELDALRLTLNAVRPSPGDIVRNPYAEAARPVRITAEQIRKAARLRARAEAALRSGQAAPGGRVESAERVREMVDQRDALDEKLRELKATPVEEVRSQSPLRPWMERARAVCDAHGARLVVVALPMDVQVSAEEWRKYGEPPQDMTETRVLLEDLVATARGLGVSGLDATGALAAAEPGAFLLGDIHMSPKGHRALAEALARTLAEPTPPRVPGRGLPPGRSRVPEPWEWAKVEEITVKGSTRAGCETYQLREWLRVTCRQQSPGSRPAGVAVVSGGRGEVLKLAVDGFTSLVAPVPEGDVLVADFQWTDRTQRLEFHGVASGPRRFLEAGPPPPTLAEPSEAEETLCACARKGEPSCPDLYGAPVRECLETYPDCMRRLACARGQVELPPQCPEGFANAGAPGHCAALCTQDRPCASGTCTEWEGGRVCL